MQGFLFDGKNIKEVAQLLRGNAPTQEARAFVAKVATEIANYIRHNEGLRRTLEGHLKAGFSLRDALSHVPGGKLFAKVLETFGINLTIRTSSNPGTGRA